MRKRQAEHEPLIDRLGSLGVDDAEAIEASMPAQHTQRWVAARVAAPPASSPASSPDTQRDAPPATQPATQRDAPPPPSDAAVHRMGVAAAVGALRAHVAVARVAEESCAQLAALCHLSGGQG